MSGTLSPDLTQFINAGGHREVEIPVPVPNTEVKHPFADDTAFWWESRTLPAFFLHFSNPLGFFRRGFFYPKIFSKSTQILINHENFKKGIPDLNFKILFLNHPETTTPCCSLVRVGEGIEPPTQRRKVHFRSLVQVIPFKVAHRSRAFSGIIQGVLSLESSWHSY